MRDNGAGVPSQRELQQAAVAELGQLALGGCTFGALCARAVDMLARHLNVRFVKLLELDAERDLLVVRAGVGWKPGIVGHAEVPADAGSQAGFSLRTADTVVVHDFASERRFSRPKLLADHDIQSGASVIVGPVSRPWGVLGVHESEIGRCAFNRYDVDFVRSVANILWLHLRNEAAVTEIEEERQALRAFADAMPILFATIDAEGRYEFVNSAYAVFGPRSEMIGRHVSDLLAPEAYQRFAMHMELALAGEVVRYENRLIVGGSETRDVLVTLAPRRAGGGRPEAVFATVVDITDQKQRQREILERTQQFRAIADSIPYGVWTCDATGRLTYVSESFLGLVGLSFAEARDFGWLARLLPGAVEETRLAWDECVARRGQWEREHRFMGSDGRHYDILAIARPVFDASGELLSYVGLNLDITERKRREEKLSVLSAELDHRVKNVFALVSTIARMSSRTAVDVRSFTDAFESRLQSLAAAHQLAARGHWEGMTLHALLATEFAPFEGVARSRITLDGPDTAIDLRAVQPLALAFHELVTNAVKHGALGRREGSLSVRWQRTPTGGCRIDWRESGVHGLGRPGHMGFGSTVLEQVLSVQLGATVEQTWHACGLEVAIELPADCLASVASV